jgi:2'-5' RNA ligase
LPSARSVSFFIQHGSVKGGPDRATIDSAGGQNAIQDVYRALISLLAQRDITPLYRESGLRAHVTLGHAPRPVERFKAPVQWCPADLLLIESEVGLSRHNVVGRWPLLPPLQGSLPFARQS